jgi:hypothetical protein
MEHMSEPQGYLDAVTAWLRGNIERDDVTAASASPYGSDWNGDTEGGFYSSFELTIRWTDEQGREGWTDVDGDDMDSLWRFVVNAAWPQPDIAAS